MENDDEIDEFEATWIRGGSPTQTAFSSRLPSPVYKYDEDDRKSYKKKRRSRRYSSNNDDDQQYLTDTNIEPKTVNKKRQVCKFFANSHCMKQNNCDYMHDEFPCKYYYLGVDHPNNSCGTDSKMEPLCKFYHGPPLELPTRKILIKHIITAPSEILGDFPKFTPREVAEKFDAQHLVLMQKFAQKTPTINSNNDQGDTSSSTSSKIKKRTRWSPVSSSSSSSTIKKKNLDQLRDILMPKQITQLVLNGIESVEQIFDMSLTQLTKFGLNVMEINDLQMKILNARNDREDDCRENMGISDVDMRQRWVAKEHKISYFINFKNISPVYSCLDVDMRQRRPENQNTLGNVMQAFTPIVKVHYTDFVQKINEIEENDNNNIEKSKLHTNC